MVREAICVDYSISEALVDRIKQGLADLKVTNAKTQPKDVYRVCSFGPYDVEIWKFTLKGDPDKLMMKIHKV